MTKVQYLDNLKSALASAGIDNPSLYEYYAEMLEDRIEDGMSEEEAVAAMEPVEKAVEAARLDMPVTALVYDKIKDSHEKAAKKGHGVLWIILAIIGFPVWLPLLASLFVVILSMYIALWAIIFSIYAVELSLGVSAIGCMFIPFIGFFQHIPFVTVIGSIGCGLMLGGITILLWKPIIALSIAAIQMFKIPIRGIKKLFVR